MHIACVASNALCCLTDIVLTTGQRGTGALLVVAAYLFVANLNAIAEPGLKDLETFRFTRKLGINGTEA